MVISNETLVLYSDGDQVVVSTRTEATAQDVFLSIAQMEKKHMGLLARVFKKCTR